jgi:hypothetical protein
MFERFDASRDCDSAFWDDVHRRQLEVMLQSHRSSNRPVSSSSRVRRHSSDYNSDFHMPQNTYEDGYD